MAKEEFRVIFTDRAWTDLEEIVDYWAKRDEPERGVQYAHDLPDQAIRILSSPNDARAEVLRFWHSHRDEPFEGYD